MSKPSNEIADQLSGEESKSKIDAEQSQRATIERIKAELILGNRDPLVLNSPEGQLAEAELIALRDVDFYNYTYNGVRLNPNAQPPQARPAQPAREGFCVIL